MPPPDVAAPPEAYKRVLSVDDLRGLSGHTMAFHPEFARHFIGSVEMYCVDGKFLTYFDREVMRWLVAPSHSVFGLPRDLSFLDKLIPGSDFSAETEVPGHTPNEGLPIHHWLEEDVLSHLSKALKTKRFKPLRAYHEECVAEVTVRPGHIDLSRWDEYIGWSRDTFEDSWLLDFDAGFRSFFASSPLAMPLSFYLKDRLIGVYIGGALPHQYEMFTHVCDPEFARFSKFMIMSALDFGVKNHGRAYTLPDFYEDEEMMQKDWKTLWKLPSKVYYCYGAVRSPVPVAAGVETSSAESGSGKASSG